MKTLDYLHLNETKLTGVVNALHKLLANFQVHYTNLRGLHWNIKGRGFFTLHMNWETYVDYFSRMKNLRQCITTQPKR